MPETLHHVVGAPMSETELEDQVQVMSQERGDSIVSHSHRHESESSERSVTCATVTRQGGHWYRQTPRVGVVPPPPPPPAPNILQSV